MGPEGRGPEEIRDAPDPIEGTGLIYAYRPDEAPGRL